MFSYLKKANIIQQQVQAQLEMKDTIDWGLKALNIPSLWSVTKGKGIKVAVLDTGIAKRHRDLKDSFIKGKDFTGKGDFSDGNGHSTHVSGIIAARANDIGIVGVAPECDLLIAKVLSDHGSGRYSWIVDGMKWAMDEGADIISMSLGGPYSDKSLKKMCAKVIEAGKILIVAAGNNGRGKDTIGYPGKYPNVITVGSVKKGMKRSTFSSTGPTLEIMAPGENILSCIPPNGYARYSGTCIAEGCYIYTADGPVTIENVEVGQKTYSFNSAGEINNQNKVNAVIPQGKNTVYQLRAAGRDVLLTETHKVQCVNIVEKDLEWVKLCDLNPDKHKILVPTKYPSTNKNQYLDNILSEDVCYLIGFFLGDGWISDTKRGLRMCFARKSFKPETMKKVEEIYDKQFAKPLKNNLKSTWMYDDNTRTALIFEALGLNRYAQEKTLPGWFYSLPLYKQWSLFNGYCAADGHVYKQKDSNSESYCFECTSSDLVRKFAIWYDFIGLQHITCSSRTRETQPPHSPQPVKSTFYALRSNLKPLESTWTCVNSPRDFAGLNMGEFVPASFRIDEVGKRQVYDLSMEKEHNFITQGLITHNSMSTPLVAGVAALILAHHRIPSEHGTPCCNQEQMIGHLVNTATDIEDPGFDNNTGWGIINPKKAIYW